MEKAFEGGSGARPCSTLFIANLGPNCTEDELKQLLPDLEFILINQYMKLSELNIKRNEKVNQALNIGSGSNLRSDIEEFLKKFRF